MGHVGFLRTNFSLYMLYQNLDENFQVKPCLCLPEYLYTLSHLSAHVVNRLIIAQKPEVDSKFFNC